jgi:4-diphosphocytidyl-2-C-methyl-D-erythritol kinase
MAAYLGGDAEEIVRLDCPQDESDHSTRIKTAHFKMLVLGRFGMGGFFALPKALARSVLVKRTANSSIAYNSAAMTGTRRSVTVRSFAKINLGLYIGERRADGYHGLRTVYQTIALHDLIRVEVGPGNGIEIVCLDPRVPADSSNTCYRVTKRLLEELGANWRVRIEIEKRLPVQGGLGAASSNAVATIRALASLLKQKAPQEMMLRVASEVGSDLPLFLIGGTVLGVGRGEEVYPVEDLPSLPMVVVTPKVGVSTPQAFADWDAQEAAQRKLTGGEASDRLFAVSRALSAWLGGTRNTGASAKSGSRVRNLLSDLVRTGIENDFEKVVFPQYPELRDVKGAVLRAGAKYASLSGSGSTLYGLFGSPGQAKLAAKRLEKQGLQAIVSRTLGRREYRQKWL